MIFLDNNSSTKVDPRVVEAIVPFYSTYYANPASDHSFGTDVNKMVNLAREKVSSLIGCYSNDIIFTSGATEAINTAIKGIAHNYSSRGKHIITVKTEHPAVLDVCRYLSCQGFDITFLGVNTKGVVDIDELRANLRPDTILVCVMMVNNETGVIQPIEQLASVTHESGSFFMSDGTQAVGKMPIDVGKLGIDILAFSGHKFYAPKGIGALYLSRKIKISPLVHGGGHEKGIRSGTLNVPGVIGLGSACEIAEREMQLNKHKIKKQRDYLENEMLRVEESFVNGDRGERLYNVTNICFKGVDANALMIAMQGVIVSSGAACSSRKIEASHVLKAMGLSDEDAHCSIRFSLGKFNTDDEIHKVVKKIKSIVPQLRVVSS